MIKWGDFEKVDIRVGKIVDVTDYPEARNPSYILKIDFGKDIGEKKSCAQLPANYSIDELKGTLISAVINFPPKQIGRIVSEVLVLGFPDEHGSAVLVRPTKHVPLGGRLF